MQSSLNASPWADDVVAQQRLNAATWRHGYAVCGIIALIGALVSWSSASYLFAPAGLVLVVGLVLCVLRPVWGVYLTVFIAILGDAGILPSYPFTKNLSSYESVLYIGDGLTFSPLELLLVALAFSWVTQMFATRQWSLYRGRLFVPIVVFMGFVVVGLLWGLGRGGVGSVAFWEVRPVLYVGVIFVLVTNLFDRFDQYRRLLWVVMAALTVNSLVALSEYGSLSAVQRDSLDSLGEHGAAVQAAALIIFTLAAWLFRYRSPARLLLLVMVVPVGWAFLVAERRAGMVALIAGVILVAIVLRWRDRWRFWLIVPFFVIFSAGYVTAFWGNDGAAGFPAQAVKSVIAPNQQSAEDQASDDYREIEHHNIIATIRSNPVLGVGFGQKFHMVWPLPSISFFVFWEYITHNAILWIWMKAGIGGFLAMLMVFATALRTGARALLRSDTGAPLAVTVTSVAFVLMFAVFAFVDIAWDTRNVVLLAVALAQIDRAVPRRELDPEAEPEPELELASAPA